MKLKLSTLHPPLCGWKLFAPAFGPPPSTLLTCRTAQKQRGCFPTQASAIPPARSACAEVGPRGWIPARFLPGHCRSVPGDSAHLGKPPQHFQPQPAACSYGFSAGALRLMIDSEEELLQVLGEKPSGNVVQNQAKQRPAPRVCLNSIPAWPVGREISDPSFPSGEVILGPGWGQTGIRCRGYSQGL